MALQRDNAKDLSQEVHLLRVGDPLVSRRLDDVLGVGEHKADGPGAQLLRPIFLGHQQSVHGAVDAQAFAQRLLAERFQALELVLLGDGEQQGRHFRQVLHLARVHEAQHLLQHLGLYVIELERTLRVALVL